LLAACATPPEHLTFKEVMSHQVGKSIDDADAYPVFYRLRQMNVKSLPNGHEQHEYAAGRKGDCRLFFEVEPLTRRIVKWSYEGSERECVISNTAPRT
jgi:hypothetical protein